MVHEAWNIYYQLFWKMFATPSPCRLGQISCAAVYGACLASLLSFKLSFWEPCNSEPQTVNEISAPYDSLQIRPKE